MLQFDDRLKKVYKQFEISIIHKKTTGELFNICKFIAKSPNSQNILRIFHIFLNLGTQSPDVHINRAISDKSVITPDMIKDLVPRIDPARIAR
jgi:hypothetical protein